eukprot:COSAG06_NODE_271_length_18677_cov_157.113360_17_plen_167_part_00
MAVRCLASPSSSDAPTHSLMRAAAALGTRTRREPAVARKRQRADSARVRTCVRAVVLQTNRAYGGRPFMYGTAEPGETVTITGLDRRSANGVPYPTVADVSGAWRLQLDPYQGPAVFNATITGSVSTNVITIRDVVYGDVVLCSGKRAHVIERGETTCSRASQPAK